MPIAIKTTGWDDYQQGSENIKQLIIGGPGAGKTRRSRSWPRPFLLDCENGRGSLADSAVPYVEVHNSVDMLAALEHLKSLETIPKHDRPYRTVVVDTIDALQRLIKDEWLQDQAKGVFTGYDAWGYLDSKMGMILTRLLNLDYHVIVNVHFKERGGREEGEQREYGVQLQGSLADTIYNDFGLVGWLGTYWEFDTEANERVQRRGLTYQPTPERPFLKDRFGVTAKWMPVTFDSTDYTELIEAFAAKADSAVESQQIGEVPDVDPSGARDVVAPGSGGPVTPRPVRERPLVELTKAELLERAKDLGITVKGNALKAEIITMLEAAPRGAAPGESQSTGAAPAAEVASQAPQPPAESGHDPEQEATAPPADDTTALAEPQANPEPDQVTETDADPASSMTAEEVGQALGGTVIDEEPTEKPAEPEALTASEPGEVCEECGKPLAGENQDYVQLAWFKFRRKLCAADYAAARKR